jgi:DNA modification methylase
VNRTIFGDCRDTMRDLKAQGVRVQCCVTSPPYYGLRSYGIGTENGEIGLEKTPAEYVAALVEVFDCVRDLLADDGVLWMNLGDSYAAGGNGVGSGKQLTNVGSWMPPKKAPPGLKPKDLIGIPWRVAFALQQPRYTGRIKNELDRVWLAAMIDGEGCFYVHKRPAGQHAGDGYFRKTDTYSPAFEVANTHKAIVDRCLQIAGCGSVICQEKDRRQPLWRWTVRSDEARQLAREIFPYLVGKQQQCRIVCGMPNSGERAEAAWQAMKLLHHGSGTDVDFDTPASCHSPGWYLRQDVIWSKPNPMPESVTDRCTKAHEYLFLLSKSERYFWDAEAMQEPAVWVPGGFAGNPARAHSMGREPSGNERPGAKPEGGDTRNRRSVWTVPTQPYSGAHFATFPPALIEPCILAGSRPGDIVLDPFMGSGTTAQVAQALGRQWIGCELNPEYGGLQLERTAQAALSFEADAKE